MKCPQCNSSKLKAYNFKNLDYIFNYVNDKWVLSNPRLDKIFFSSKNPYEISCTQCKHRFLGSLDLNNIYRPAVNHREIVLDLDHTLFNCHYFTNPEESVSGHIKEFKDPEYPRITYQLFPRPYLKEFIKECLIRFDKINFFTAATDWYAKILIEQLNIPVEKMGYLKTRKDTYIDRPLSFEREHIKVMHESLMVEDKPLVVEGYNNTIFKVEAYYNQSSDQELLNLINYFNQKESKLLNPSKFNGEIELFLQRVYIPVKNMPLNLIEKLLEIIPLSQEEINNGKVRTSFFDSYYELDGEQVRVKIVGLKYEEYLQFYNLIKPYTTQKKIPRSKFK